MKTKWEQSPKIDEPLDLMLKLALTPAQEPDELLNQKILHQWKEKKSMKSGKKKLSAAIAAVCILSITVTVGAAIKYLSPKQIADEMGYMQISEAFQTEDAIEINQSQSAGGYNFALLGVTKGEKLITSDLGKDQINTEDFYAVVAISKADGSPMPKTSVDSYGEVSFFMSPLIQGLKPWQYNAASMSGGYTESEKDGIMYRMVSCDNVYLFADRKLYFCICDSTFYNTEAYNYDETTGEVTVNESYNGINLLFDLPLDKAKADPEKADAYLKELEDSWNADEDTDSSSDAEMEADAISARTNDDLKKILDGDLSTVLEGAELMEASTQILTMKKDETEYGKGENYFEYTYAFDTGMAGTIPFYENDITDGICADIQVMGDDEHTTEYITILQMNDDGTATVNMYKKEISF